MNVVSSNFGFLPLDFSPQHCKLLDVSLLKTTGLSSIPHFVPVTISPFTFPFLLCETAVLVKDLKH